MEGHRNDDMMMSCSVFAEEGTLAPQENSTNDQIGSAVEIFDKHKHDRRIKQERTSRLLGDMDEYDVILKDRSKICVGTWHDDKKVVEIIQMKGNFWRTHGFSENGKDYLYPEEALLLYEKSLIRIEANGIRMSLKDFYNVVVGIIGLPCYLCYVKLKNLEYLVYRHNRGLDSQLIFVESQNQFLDVISSQSPHLVFAFDIYLHKEKWSKKAIADLPPLHHVVVQSCDFFPSFLVLQSLFHITKSIPMMFAVVTTSWHIILEELSNAETSLHWNNELAFPESALHSHDIIDVDQHIRSYRKNRKELQNRNKRKINPVLVDVHGSIASVNDPYPLKRPCNQGSSHEMSPSEHNEVQCAVHDIISLIENH